MHVKGVDRMKENVIKEALNSLCEEGLMEYIEVNGIKQYRLTNEGVNKIEMNLINQPEMVLQLLHFVKDTPDLFYYTINRIATLKAKSKNE
nr:MAG: hypothetical protein [Lokiarchaeota virus Ratatoskr Meg22_1012]